MQLKLRKKTPSYWTATGDFAMLASRQQEYRSSYSGHMLYPADKYHTQKQRIEKEWSTSTGEGGGRFLKKDLEELYSANEQMGVRDLTFRARINSDILFKRWRPPAY